jgi:hypothetical protein
MTDNIIAFRRPYQTAQSTIDAFWYLVQLNDPARLKAWLQDRQQDRQTLLKLYEERQNVEA